MKVLKMITLQVFPRMSETVKERLTAFMFLLAGIYLLSPRGWEMLSMTIAGPETLS